MQNRYDTDYVLILGLILIILTIAGILVLAALAANG